jgi:hypothetical protein
MTFPRTHPGTQGAEVIDVAVRLRDVRQRLAALKQEADALAARLRLLEGIGELAIPDGHVTITQPMRFSPELAKQLLSPEKLKEITVVAERIDEKLARDKLTGEIFEKLKEPSGEPRITFGG